MLGKHRRALAFLLLASIPPAVQASILYVDAASTNPVAPYASWATAAATIQAAVDAAVSGDEILVTNGVYATGGAVRSGVTNRVAADTAVKIRSVNGPALTRIVGGPQVRGVHLAGSASLQGFTVTGGQTETDGGGIRAVSTASMISNCVIELNQAGQNGGGVFGGSLFRCSVVSNTSGTGASAVTAAILRDCLVRHNTGVGCAGSTLYHCTVAYNTDTGSASNYQYGCIVYFNGPGGAYNIDSWFALQSCCADGLNEPGVLAADPQFAAPDNPRPLGSSPCIDRTNGWASTALDLAGVPRVHGWTADLGAYEYTPAACTGALAVTLVPLDGLAATQHVTSLRFRAEVHGVPLDVAWHFEGSPAVEGLSTVERVFPVPGVRSVVLVASNLDTSVAVTQQVQVTALPAIPVLTPSAFDMGVYTAGAPFVASFVISNAGGLVYTGVASVSGPPFALASPTNLSLPGGSWTTLAVTCTFEQPGVFTGRLEVAGNGGTLTSAVQATLPVPLLTRTPTLLDLGRIEELTTAQGAIVVSNAGGARLTGIVASISAPFEVASPSAFSLLPGAATNILVGIAALPIGFYTGSVVFASNGGGLTSSVQAIVGVVHLYVTTNGSDAAAGTSWMTAKATVQGALDAFDAAGGVVHVGPGTHASGQRTAPDGAVSRMVVTNPVVIIGENGPAETTIAGGNLIRCAYLAAGSTLRGLTLTNGDVVQRGGGVRATSLLERIEHCVIAGNRSGDAGGGVEGATLEGCVLRGNSALNGGGGSGSRFVNCAIVGNVASNAGGGTWNASHVNTLVYYNSAPVSQNHAAGSFTNSCATPLPPGPGNFADDPLLQSLEMPVPIVASPCVDRGTNAAVTVTVDLSGNPRISGAAVDIGAYEVDPFTCTGGISAAIQFPLGATNGVGVSTPFAAALSGCVQGFEWRFEDGVVVTNATFYERTLPGPAVHIVRLVASNSGGTAEAVATVVVAHATGTLVWSGTTNRNWDVGVTPNWNGRRFFYTNGTHVRFDDSGGGGVVTKVGTLTPASVVVDAATNYDFRSGGTLAGAMTLTKLGSGTLYMAASDTFTGDVSILRGVVDMAGTSLGDPDVGETYVWSNATLIANSTIYEHIHLAGRGQLGTGALCATVNDFQQTGPIRMTLEGDAFIWINGRRDMRGTNTELNLNGRTLEVACGLQFSLAGTVVTNAGSIVATFGRLSLESAAIVSGPGSILVKSNAMLTYWRTAHVSKPILLDGCSISTFSVPSTAGAPHIVLAPATIITPAPLWITNTISGSGTLYKTGPTSLYLCASTAITGGLSVVQGLVELQAQGAEGYRITNDALVRFSAAEPVVLNSGFVLRGGGVTIIDATSGVTVGVGADLAPTGTIQVAQTVPATLTLTSGASLSPRNLWIGETNVSGAIMQVGGDARPVNLRIGQCPGATSRYVMTAGSLAISNGLDLSSYHSGLIATVGVICVGSDGCGEFLQRGGTVRAPGLVMDDRFATAGDDVYVLEGGSLSLGRLGIQGHPSSRILLGGGVVSATEDWTTPFPLQLTGTNGSVVFDSAGFTIRLPAPLTGVGGFIKSGAGTLALGSVSNSYAGETTVAGGTLQLEAAPVAGRGALPPGRPVDVLPGGVLRVAAMDALGVGTGAVSSILLDEGTLSMASGLQAAVGALALHGGAISADGAGTFVLDGPLSTVAHSLPARITAGTLVLRGGPDTSSVSIAVARGAADVDLRIDSALTGAGFHKTGPGLLELAGNSTLAGPVAISNGTLIVSGVLGTGPVTIAAGAALLGTGTLASAVTAEGVIAPGFPFGRLTLQGTCTLSAASALLIDVAGTTLGPSCDRLVLAQPVALAGALVVTFTNGFAPSSHEVFVALSAPAVAGTFDSVSVMGAGPGWSAVYGSNAVLIVQTNVLAAGVPGLSCPPDLMLAAPTSSLPAPEPDLLATLSTCATLTMTWAGDVTNAGTGCAGSPRVITRSYTAASSCGTTSTCQQLFILEDTQPPVLTLKSGEAANLDFEDVTSTAWQVFGPPGLAGFTAYGQRSGSRALQLGIDKTSRIALDSGPVGGNGLYGGTAVLGQPPAVTSLLRSTRFGATGSAMVAGPFQIATNAMTFTAWLNRSSNHVSRRGFLGTRLSATNYTGFCFGAGNALCYEWNGQTNTRTWNSGLVVPTSQWVFAALSVSPSSAVIRLRSAGGWSEATNMVSHALIPLFADLEIGRDGESTNQFGGLLNDVQIYHRALDGNEVASLWNGGAGDVTLGGLLRRWKLNDSITIPSNQVFGVYQDVAAAAGQRWRARFWAIQSAGNPLAGTNRVEMAIEFLNGGGAALSNAVATLGPPLSATVFEAREAVGTAPTGTMTARLTFRYKQDAAGSPGRILVDAGIFGDKVINAGASINQCGLLPDFLTTAVFFSASDAFSGTNLVLTQSPPPGSSYTSNKMDIVIGATDVCGNSRSNSIRIDIVDTAPPIAFSVSPSNPTLLCPTALPTNTFNFFDNCSVRSISLVSSVTNPGTGCGSSRSVITNIYAVIDLGGFTRTSQQIVVRFDGNAPTINLIMAGLTNGGFEAGATNWTFQGPAVVTNLTPRSGLLHALLDPPAGDPQGTQLSQTLTAASGQPWRLGAWMRRPDSEPAPSGSALELRLLFLDAGSNLLAAATTRCDAVSCLPDTYRQVSVTATSPSASAFVVAQFAHVTNAGPTCSFAVDDVRLSPLDRTLDDFGTATLPHLLGFTVFTEICSQVVSAQIPIPGSPVAPGTNLAQIVASDACLNTRTSTVQIVGIDETPPTFVAAPPDQIVAQLGDIPPPSLALVSAIDAGSAVTITNLPDLVGPGAGTTNDPILVTRRYRATDVTGNVAEYRQTFLVGAAMPTGYRLFAAGIPNAFAQGIADDPDGDGYANLLEYATGGTATNADAFARLDALRLGGGLALVFNRSTGAVDAVLIVEGSTSAASTATWLGLATNLAGHWGGTTNVVESGTGTPVTVTVVDPVSGASNRFLRLKVALP